MSRTDEIRKGGGGRERGGSGGGGVPFVKWGDTYTWLEGLVTGSFETKYGLAVTLRVDAIHADGLKAQGRDDEGNEYVTSVALGTEVNIGTQSATLEGKITDADKGKCFHVAFEGWEESKAHNRYRVFAVIELTERDDANAADGSDDEEPQRHQHDDDLPF